MCVYIVRTVCVCAQLIHFSCYRCSCVHRRTTTSFPRCSLKSHPLYVPLLTRPYWSLRCSVPSLILFHHHLDLYTHTYTHSLSLTHTHTHTHTHIHTLTHIHTHTLSLSHTHYSPGEHSTILGPRKAAAA